MADLKEAAEFLAKSCEVAGVAQASVSDGTIFMFKKEFLKRLIEENPEADTVLIFVKVRDAEDVN